ncbi:DUF3325 domain-containing protein, partial [Variovorax paradoxus]|uniref:DUF3325 domain-containing protein n=2 Tax=Comamonadaceae TaxID=80864 RepID=UPI0039953A83
SEALMLAAALAANLVGAGLFALSMDVHWEQARPGTAYPVRMARVLRVLGAACLVVSLLLCLRVDHVSMASLVWFMALAGAALAVTFTLSWRPRWLAPLVAWIPARPATTSR